jgi:ABC-type transport system involved in multi-copper enzyme maturation permease subunit
MSAQTGQEAPIGPISTRPADRLRFRVATFLSEPNPIWIRELKQSARLGRTPIILMVVTILMTLTIASVGGVMSDKTSDQVGVTVYQTYFSIAFFLVTWLGPGVAANSIASEREGRTLEAVMLTGLTPEAIARGKFLAAMTFISTYIVMLAPVGALAFLFGGVTATEVLLAFFYLFVFALLFVALGLAISSKMSSLRASILVTLLVSVPLSLFCFGALGYGLSSGIHDIWRQVPRERPVWLPTAYVRADFDRVYALVLVLLPLLAFGIPTWLLYETTVANLKSPSEDRSTRLKRWYLASLFLIALASIASVWIAGEAALAPALISLVLIAFLLAFSVLVFLGEPVSLSRRVKAERSKRARSNIFLPSAINASVVQLVFGCMTIALVGAYSFHVVEARDPAAIPYYGTAFSRVAAYTFGFFVFLVGFSAWLRARVARPFLARILVVGVVAFVSIVPWVVAAIAGTFTPQAEEGLFIAAPSPFFAFYMFAEAEKTTHIASNIGAGWMCIVGWTVLGMGFLVSAFARTRRVVATLDRAVEDTDQKLAEEDTIRETAELRREAEADAVG